jgi:hypothetical protein
MLLIDLWGGKPRLPVLGPESRTLKRLRDINLVQVKLCHPDIPGQLDHVEDNLVPRD